MLEQVLRHLNNRFDADANGKRYGSSYGSFDTRDLYIPTLKEGQYFWIEGSALNDGLHMYPADDLNDEAFTGRIVYLVIPKPVIELADEIADWVDNNSRVIESPLKSESFGGYSYTKEEGTNASLSGWQAHFASRLNPYRKISRNWV